MEHPAYKRRGKGYVRYSTNLKRHSVDRHLLLHNKLIRIGVNGEIFFMIMGRYTGKRQTEDCQLRAQQMVSSHAQKSGKNAPFVLYYLRCSQKICKQISRVDWSRNSEGGEVFVGQKMIALKFANDVVAVAIRNKGVTVSGSCSDRWEDT